MESHKPRSILRWAGSKRLLLLQLLNRTNQLRFSDYHEPFVGSAVLFFALKPAKAILSDLNPDLIQFYQYYQKHPKLLYRAACKLVSSQDAYYEIRAIDPGSLDDLDRAARFLYLNRYCFNGIYRTNRNGQFNVPYGKRTGGMPIFSDFLSFWYRLKKAEIIHGDFESVTPTVSSDSFVYLDPPYDYTKRRDRGEYGPGSFQSVDLLRLERTLEQLDAKGATFLLSYLDVPEIERISTRWNWTRVDVKRQIAAFSKDRKIISEVLVSNNPNLVEA